MSADDDEETFMLYYRQACILVERCLVVFLPFCFFCSLKRGPVFFCWYSCLSYLDSTSHYRQVCILFEIWRCHLVLLFIKKMYFLFVFLSSCSLRKKCIFCLPFFILVFLINNQDSTSHYRQVCMPVCAAGHLQWRQYKLKARQWVWFKGPIH